MFRLGVYIFLWKSNRSFTCIFVLFWYTDQQCPSFSERSSAEGIWSKERCVFTLALRVRNIRCHIVAKISTYGTMALKTAAGRRNSLKIDTKIAAQRHCAKANIDNLNIWTLAFALLFSSGVFTEWTSCRSYLLAILLRQTHSLNSPDRLRVLARIDFTLCCGQERTKWEGGGGGGELWVGGTGTVQQTRTDSLADDRRCHRLQGCKWKNVSRCWQHFQRARQMLVPVGLVASRNLETRNRRQNKTPVVLYVIIFIGWNLEQTHTPKKKKKKNALTAVLP